VGPARLTSRPGIATSLVRRRRAERAGIPCRALAGARYRVRIATIVDGRWVAKRLAVGLSAVLILGACGGDDSSESSDAAPGDAVRVDEDESAEASSPSGQDTHIAPTRGLDNPLAYGTYASASSLDIALSERRTTRTACSSRSSVLGRSEPMKRRARTVTRQCSQDSAETRGADPGLNSL
jgi:hypothetical protein